MSNQYFISLIFKLYKTKQNYCINSIAQDLQNISQVLYLEVLRSYYFSVWHYVLIHKQSQTIEGEHKHKCVEAHAEN